MEDGRIQGLVHGQEILINQVLIHEQFGISKEGIIDVAMQPLMKSKSL